MYVTVGEDDGYDSTDYFTIDGVRVANPDTPGIYIVRRADGSTAKTVIK